MAKRGYGAFAAGSRPTKIVKGRSTGIAALLAAKMRARRQTFRSFGVPRNMYQSNPYRREIKYVDVANTSSTLTSAATPPTAISLNALSQGAAAFNRIGQKIILKSLRVRGTLSNSATAVQGVGRILIVYDRQANAALPVWTDVITATTAAGTASSTVRDGISMANRERYRVLADEQLLLPSVTNTAGVLTNVGALNSTDKNPTMWNFDRFIPLKNMETHYNNVNGGTFADIQSGSISIFFACDPSSDGKWAMTWTSRLRFDDM